MIAARLLVHDRRRPLVARTDAHGVRELVDKDLAVARRPRAQDALGCIRQLRDGHLTDDGLDLDLWHEVDVVLAPAIDFLVPLLHAAAVDLTDGHAEHADLVERLFELLEFFGARDDVDFIEFSFHCVSPLLSAWDIDAIHFRRRSQVILPQGIVVPKKGGDRTAGHDGLDVAALAVLGDIEPLDLVCLARPHGCIGVDDAKEDVRADDGKAVGDEGREDLRPQEGESAAVKQPVCAVGIDRRRRPQPRGERAPCAADAVDAERIEGVVIAEPCLDNGDGRIADSTADQTDEDGGECRDESRRRGDGDEPLRHSRRRHRGGSACRRAATR